MLFRVGITLLCVAVLAGCSTTGVQTTTTLPQPEKPAITSPQPSANWENLGVSPNGNILNELDKLSISRDGSLVTFRDRKTIFNMKKENFLSTPRHKLSVNTWQIDCKARTYRLVNMSLFDENGREIASYAYNDNQIKPMPIIKNSASYQQMLAVCKDTPNI